MPLENEDQPIGSSENFVEKVGRKSEEDDSHTETIEAEPRVLEPPSLDEDLERERTLVRTVFRSELKVERTLQGTIERTNDDRSESGTNTESSEPIPPELMAELTNEKYAMGPKYSQSDDTDEEMPEIGTEDESVEDETVDSESDSDSSMCTTTTTAEFTSENSSTSRKRKRHSGFQSAYYILSDLCDVRVCSLVVFVSCSFIKCSSHSRVN